MYEENRMLKRNYQIEGAHWQQSEAWYREENCLHSRSTSLLFWIHKIIIKHFLRDWYDASDQMQKWIYFFKIIFSLSDDVEQIFTKNNLPPQLFNKNALNRKKRHNSFPSSFSSILMNWAVHTIPSFSYVMPNKSI